MANNNDIAAQTETSQPTPAASGGEPSAKDAPFPIATPVMRSFHASQDAAAIALDKLETAGKMDADAKPSAPSPADAAPPPRRPQPALLAASVALALVLGTLVGAGATWNLQQNPERAQHAATLAETAQRLQDSLALLQGQVGALKSEIDGAQRNANAQFGKLHASLDRLAKHAAIQQAAPDTTGSVTAVAKQAAAPKQEDKHESNPPQAAEGFHLRDYHPSGRAIVETPNGRLYDVGAGSNLPGLGRVQAIRREAGQIVLVTPKGTIAAALETRRSRYYRAYR
jgi:glucose/arabinose dehydrogenase